MTTRPYRRQRRIVREGGQPRGTPISFPRPGHRAGLARRWGWTAYVRQPARAGMCGSPRSCTTPDLLTESFMDLKRSAAAGVDGVTWDAYESGLAEKIAALCDAVQSGRYRALPSRRVYIQKANGSQRPLGIAALEDKIVQQAVVMVLTTIYETDFLGFSYGFRPERSQHQALDALWIGFHRRKVNFVLDADIKSFFDTIDHGWMMRFLEHRIADRRMLRLIRKWLNAGVVENGIRTTSRVGTPQGAVMSPLLANVYLHYVFDLWTHRWRRREAKGDVIVVRYADDSVMGFETPEDTRGH